MEYCEVSTRSSNFLCLVPCVHTSKAFHSFPQSLLLCVYSRFPGQYLLALNCNRRLLPASALSRVFFPTVSELTAFFTLDALPKGMNISPAITITSIEYVVVCTAYSFLIRFLVVPNESDDKLMSLGFDRLRW
jgi:hypothetical protein